MSSPRRLCTSAQSLEGSYSGKRALAFAEASRAPSESHLLNVVYSRIFDRIASLHRAPCWLTWWDEAWARDGLQLCVPHLAMLMPRV